MPRAVLDPNVLISALLTPRGTSADVVRKLREGAFEIVVSPLLLAELDGVLRREKFRAYVTLEEVDSFVELIRRTAILVDDPGPSTEKMSEDPGDEYLIALARETSVGALVSGDPHLTRLRARIPVMTPRQFLDSLTGD